MRFVNKILVSGFCLSSFAMQTTLSAEWVNESISVNDATYVSKRPVLEKRAFVSSAHKDNPADFSRGWFAWANTLFAELVLKISEKYPDKVFKYRIYQN